MKRWVIGQLSHRLNESSLMSHHLSGDLGWWQTDFNICNIRIWFWSIVFWQDIWYFSCLISILLCHVIILTSRDGNGVANLWQIFKRNSFLTIFFSKQDNGYPDWFTNRDWSRLRNRFQLQCWSEPGTVPGPKTVRVTMCRMMIQWKWLTYADSSKFIMSHTYESCVWVMHMSNNEVNDGWNKWINE